MNRVLKTPRGLKHCYNYFKALDSNNSNITLFCHGLYGSKHEFDDIASDERLLNLTNIYALDHVNHPEFAFDNQAEYIIDFLDNISSTDTKATLVGHSMGGRACMRTALLYPERIKAVMALDAPATSFTDIPGYMDQTYALVKYFKDFDLSKFPKLDSIEEHMKEKFKFDDVSLQRIMRNFRYTDEEESKITWRVNPQYLHDNVEAITYFDHIGTFEGPAKMLIGGISNRWKLEHFIDSFPNIKEEDIIPIPNTSHWIHTDDPEAFITNLTDLLKRAE
ncbi:unnamed protein product [Moneuplotes crassus]|uniref:AB hydrolase-1 domain-containing protein n=1 Tax=Euplotes crassus TaxID=5936 RepID=A0AAD1USH2_EUPCR|nr:unnamed protein product [Moneuplotes crassus]